MSSLSRERTRYYLLLEHPDGVPRQGTAENPPFCFLTLRKEWRKDQERGGEATGQEVKV